jgi:16S rRNA (cytosine1402-N4)-methyltransferase
MSGTEPTCHIPVLLDEVLAYSQIEEASFFVDGTLGGGGHAEALLGRMVKDARFLGIDRDPAALQRAEGRLVSRIPEASLQRWLELPQQLPERSAMQPHAGPLIDLALGSYRDIPRWMDALGVPLADGILLDLGLSSDQLADSDRGFSFREEGPLDLRFHQEPSTESAADLLASGSEEEIADILYRYGEERKSRRIAREIVEQRRRGGAIETTQQLRQLIHRSVGKVHGKIDSATRSFQALRIAVNQELHHLADALRWLPTRLRPGGRLLVISFHSLEDRMVKYAFREHPYLRPVTKRPVVASLEELDRNNRSRTAKLRVACRVEPSAEVAGVVDEFEVRWEARS